MAIPAPAADTKQSPLPQKFPFDYIKIDGGFIRELVSNTMDRLVVQAIVSIAQELAKKTVAGFVGDQETASLLRKIGVDCAQGYYFGEPRPITRCPLTCRVNAMLTHATYR